MTDAARPLSRQEAQLSPPAWHLLKALLKFSFNPELHSRKADIPPVDHTVPLDFVGICIATSPYAECDDYIIARLRELGITHVRLDFSYDSPGQQAERLLTALVDQGFRVLLHLVQPLAEARRMKHRSEQQTWRRFVGKTLEQWGSRVEIIEIGSTVNRKRWAGYSLAGFASCWHIAWREAQQRGLRISGPNISDFEPLYSIALLDILRDTGALPHLYTNNLFVERVIEPEVYDPRVFGVLLAPLLRFNLIRKARQLQQIAVKRGVHGLICSYVSWTLPRIRRFLADDTGKQADYLSRYLLLAAASGALERVYWGALINRREGLIDDPQSEFPNGEIVTYYRSISGDSQLYTVRPAFAALRTFRELIPGSVYRGSLSRSKGLEIHEFTTDTTRIHAVWTRNARAAELGSLYSPQQLEAAQCLSHIGTELTEFPSLVGESPLYLRWPLAQKIDLDPQAQLLKGVSVCSSLPGSYYRFQDDAWHGLILAANRQDAESLYATLHPERMADNTQLAQLRRSRNAIWTVADPRTPGAELVVKQPVKLSWNKRLTEPFKPSKALRSWNGACELLRRGIASPRPVAWFEKRDGVDLLRNWYICERANTHLSVRQFFTEYAQGQERAHGVLMSDFLQQLSAFVLNMHQRGVFFKDLSGGNVLVHQDPATGQLEFSLIDTARARFYKRPLRLRLRLADLVRILHKLHWPGRMEFLKLYFAEIGASLHSVHKLPFHIYDFKADWKRALRRRGKAPVQSRS